MEAVRNYILMLCGFSFVSSVVCALLPEMPSKKTVKFVCGVILSILIISPMKNFNFRVSDIIAQAESYNLYNNGNEVQKFNQKVLADKVSEIVGRCFARENISDVTVEVVFDDDGAIAAVNIDKKNEFAAKNAAEILGLPYELMHMTE